MKITARSIIVTALSVAFYLIAMNVGSGWIYLISAGLITSLLLGILVPIIQLSGLSASQAWPSHGTHGEPLSVTLSLHNRLAPFPMQWLRCSYELSANSVLLDSSAQRFLVRTEPALASESTKDSSRSRSSKNHNSGEADCMVIPYLSHSLEWRWQSVALKRGIHRLGHIKVETSFPTGLIWWQRRLGEDTDLTITILPKIVPIDGLFLYRLRQSRAGSLGASRAQPSRQSTYTRGIRDYVRGDSPRIIHWASTARTGRLVVREFESEGLPRFDVQLDLSAQWLSASQFELAVITTSSLIALGHRLGLGPQLILNPDCTNTMTLPSTLPGIGHQMEVLARVCPQTAGPSASQAKRSERPVIVIHPENDERLLLSGELLIQIGLPAPREGNSDGSSSTRRSDLLKEILITSETDIEKL